MMHEFAHCLDISRDMPAFHKEKAIDTLSLAPVDAEKVKDFTRYLEAQKSFETRLWREAVADIFVVSYWKLTAQESARDLIATLRRKRTNEEGTQHATKCWIDYVDQAAPPPSIAALFEWADPLLHR